MDLIYNNLGNYITGKRYKHTLSVEKESINLCKIFLPNQVEKVRVAALLHDITKELSLQEQLLLCKEFNIEFAPIDLHTPKVFHAKTAAYVAKRDFPSYVDDDVFNAILYHTTGRENMTLFEKIIYLADYIEENRTFDDCIKLRTYFYDGYNKLKEKGGDLLKLLDNTLIVSFDMTIRNLLSENAIMNFDTIKSRNHLIENIYGEM